MNKKNHRGSDFREFLAEEGILEEVEARALKRAIALQLAKLIEEKSLSKSDMALRMKTSRAAVDRMLDGSNPSMTLSTLEKAARALGQRTKDDYTPSETNLAHRKRFHPGREPVSARFRAVSEHSLQAATQSIRVWA